jgi:hypothetical protein
MWEDLLIAAISETFGEPEVVGVVLSVRKNFQTLCVWHSGTADDDQALKIRVGERLRAIFHLNVRLEYRSNISSLKQRTTYHHASPDLEHLP